MAPTVCVVIAARDAQATIAEAVRSALNQAEVRRVIVVDDGSADETAGAALGADDGSSRVRTIRLPRNEGPAFARNRAIETSEEDFIAILDADDMFLPGRFARIFADRSSDMAADNIAFVPDLDAHAFAALAATVETVNRELVRGDCEPMLMTAARFVWGNISRAGNARGEMGFLKPVIRRSLLGSAGVSYDESLRLGEDYDLYLRLILAGARFDVIRTCGYLARVRAGSLSGRHATEDLKCLVAADQRLLTHPALGDDTRAALLAHARQTRARFELRRFLDRKRQAGLVRAAVELAAAPRAWIPVALGVGRDKIAAARQHRSRTASPPEGLRLLFASTT